MTAGYMALSGALTGAVFYAITPLSTYGLGQPDNGAIGFVAGAAGYGFWMVVGELDRRRNARRHD